MRIAMSKNILLRCEKCMNVLAVGKNTELLTAPVLEIEVYPCTHCLGKEGSNPAYAQGWEEAMNEIVKLAEEAKQR